jgi:hypothetical protein
MKKLKQIPALSVAQPWAHCMFNHKKNVENRNWSTRHRGFVAIHASTSKQFQQFDYCDLKYGVRVDPEVIPYGAVVGFARLVDVIKEGEVATKTAKWFFGPYGFVLEDFIALKRPVEAKGQMKLWSLDGKILDDCLKQLSSAQVKQLVS